MALDHARQRIKGKPKSECPIRRDARGRYIWVYDFRPYGNSGPRKTIRFVTESTALREAQRQAKQHVADLEASRLNRQAGLPEPPRSLQDAVDEYLKIMDTDHREGHLQNVRRTLRHLVDRHGRLTVDGLTREDLIMFRDARANATSAQTANREFREISAFLGHQVHLGRLKYNPVTGLKKLRYDRKVVHPLWPEQYAELWHRARPHVRDAMDALLVTALRKTELVDLIRGSHTGQALEGREIVIRGRKGRDELRLAYTDGLRRLIGPYLKTGKWLGLTRISKNMAMLVRAPAICRLLQDRIGPQNTAGMRRIARRLNIYPSVLSNLLKGGKQPCTVTLDKLVDLYGLKDEVLALPSMGAHVLRHTCATWLLKLGADIYHVKEHLGHGTLNQTEHYARLLKGFVWAEERELLPERTVELMEELASVLHPHLTDTRRQKPTLNDTLMARKSRRKARTQNGLNRKSRVSKQVGS